MDSVGIGELPDAAAYGDQGSNTLGNIAKQIPLKIPTLAQPRPRTAGETGSEKTAENAKNAEISFEKSFSANSARSRFFRVFGRMAEASAGKDSVTGHWEMMGIVLDRAFPTFPHGFAPEIIAEFARLHRPRRARQQGRVGHGDHRRVRA